jgi:hypothetical protein
VLAGNLNLSAGASYSQLVGATPDNAVARADGLLRVQPFDPSNSFLMRKLTGPGEGEGARMPLSADTLTAAQIAQVQTWIADGAPAADEPTSTPSAPPLPTDTPTPTVTLTETAVPSSTPTATETWYRPRHCPNRTFTCRRRSRNRAGDRNPTKRHGDITATPTLTPTATATPTDTPTVSRRHASPSWVRPRRDLPTSSAERAIVFAILTQPLSSTAISREEAVTLAWRRTPQNFSARTNGLLRCPPFPEKASSSTRSCPPGGGEAAHRGSLSAEQVEQIRAWIVRGALPDETPP